MAKDRFQIYTEMKQLFYNLSKLNIQSGSVIDSYMMASSTAAEEAYSQIEANKNPHLYTGLSGQDIDSFGMLINCPRLPNENDDTYLHRCITWTGSNESSNLIAINNALIGITNVSNANYVPRTNGVGTGTVYIIPTDYKEETISNAIAATKLKLAAVTSPGSVIDYKIPTPRKVILSIYISSSDGDMNQIKSNITKKIRAYVNTIAIGEYLEIGSINKIGVEEPNVDYFNVTQLIVDSKVITDISVLQKLDSKLLFEEGDNNIFWIMAVR